MEVLNADGKPSVIDTSDHHDHGFGFGYGHGVGYSWESGYNDRSEFNSRFYADSQLSGQQFAQAQVSTSAVSKDVAVLSKDVVISEGRLAVQMGTITRDIAVLSKDVALTEARLNLVAAQNAAAAAECCCEIKELIRAENGATRELLQATKIRELELRLATFGQSLK